MSRLLLVEDDPSIIVPLDDFLKSEGFDTLRASGVSQARTLIDREKIDLCLVDIRLGDGDGREVCRHAREKGLPVIFLTASSDENSVVSGLDLGADDYIAKPFRPRELVSRVKNVIRRYRGAENIMLPGGVEIDTRRGSVSKNGCELPLSALEYRLLMLFVNNRGVLLTRSRLLEDIWDVAGDFVNDNTLTVYIKRLREKIEPDPQEPAVIRTVRGIGYRMD